MMQAVQAEGKGPVLPVPIGGAEGCFGFGRFGKGHLPVSLSQVQCRDIPGPSQAIEELIHPRHWVTVELRDFILAAEVVAEAEGAIWFWYHDDRAGPRAVRWFNHP